MDGFESGPCATVTHFPDLTHAERVAIGRDRRKQVPRSSHAEYAVAPDRPDPIDLLEESNGSRLPELVPVRYSRMMESPFTFLRGSPIVMSWDLAHGPVTGFNVQACGDAHLLNFGSYATPERHLTFDVNDFDETVPGPWEWDVKRLAASCAVAARTVGHRTIEREAARAATHAYAVEMQALTELTTLEIHYAHTDVDTALLEPSDPVGTEDLRRLAATSRSHTTMQAVTKLTEEVDGRRRIVEHPPLIVRLPDDEWADDFATCYELYHASLPEERRQLIEQYRIVDVAQKVVGVGSVGTRCAIVLFEGFRKLDPLFLQLKEAQASVLEPWAGRSEYGHCGQRVVVGQRVMQASSDIFLGWSHVEGVDFYVRQLRDLKGSVDLLALHETTLPKYAALCGRTLARAHARSLGPSLIAGYVGNGRVFADAIATWAVAYTDQTDRDHAALVEAVRSGRVSGSAGDAAAEPPVLATNAASGE